MASLRRIADLPLQRFFNRDESLLAQVQDKTAYKCALAISDACKLRK